MPHGVAVETHSLEPQSGAAGPGRTGWLAYGDAMRVLGVLAVLMVHTCDMILFDKDAIGQPHWWACNLLDSAGRWAVPMFIMLSGALLLNHSREQTAGEFYRRRLELIRKGLQERTIGTQRRYRESSLDRLIAAGDEAVCAVA